MIREYRSGGNPGFFQIKSLFNTKPLLSYYTMLRKIKIVSFVAATCFLAGFIANKARAEDVFTFNKKSEFTENFKLNFSAEGDNGWFARGGYPDNNGCVHLDYSKKDSSYIGTVAATYTGDKYPDGVTISVLSNMAGANQGRKAGVFYKVNDNCAYALYYLISHNQKNSFLGIGAFNPNTGDFRNLKETPAGGLYKHNTWYKIVFNVKVDGSNITFSGKSYSIDGKVIESISYSVMDNVVSGEAGFMNNKYNQEFSLPTSFDDFSVSSHKPVSAKAAPAVFSEGEPADPYNLRGMYGDTIPAYQVNIKRQLRDFPADIKFENIDNLEILTYPPRLTAKYYVSKFWKLWNKSSVVVEHQCDASKPGRSEFEVRFKNPPIISHDFNRIRLWCGRIRGRTGDSAHIVIDIIDKKGKKYSVDLGTLTGWGFSLLQSELLSKNIALPVQVKAVRYSNITSPALDLVLDSLEFVNDPVKDEFTLREIIPDAPFSGGKTGKLLKANDFPVPEIKFKSGLCRPAPKSNSEFKADIYNKGKVYFFEVIQKPANITYRIQPESGGLSDISCRIGNGKWFYPAQGGGLTTGKLEASHYNAVRKPDTNNLLLETKFIKNVLLTRWRRNGTKDGIYELRYSLRGKSLIIDMNSEKGSFSGVTLGYISGAKKIKDFFVPYWMMTDSFPKMACVDNNFLSVFFDWTITDASMLYACCNSNGRGGVAVNGPAFYTEKTDGTRNAVKERLYITLSDTFEEVLPSIPNPVSRHAEKLKDVVMSTHMGCWPMIPGNTKVELEGWKLLHRLGLQKLMIRYHVDLYRSLDADLLLSDNVTSVYGLTNEKWIQLISDIKKLGYLAGPYMNFCSITSTCQFAQNSMFMFDNQFRYIFDDTNLRGYYILKPAAARYLESVIAPYLKNKFGFNMAYFDQTTLRGNGGLYTDQDARMPGAGSSSATLRNHIAILQDGSKVIGPIISEGHRHYIYAGFSDGSYHQNTCVELGSTHVPPLVDFSLRKIHQLECDFGYHLAYSQNDPDFWLASEIIYGANGHLNGGNTLFNTPMNQIKTDLVLRSYFMIQQLQKYYAFQGISKIEYHKDGQFYNTSQAIIKSTYLEGQVHTVYANGCETWVNYHPKKNWTIKGPRGKFVLPPYGYAGWMKGKVYQYSALDNGHRIDYVESPEYTYVDGRGVKKDFGKVITRDAAVILNKPAGGYRIVPVANEKNWLTARELTVNLQALFPDIKTVSITKYDDNDHAVWTKDFNAGRKIQLACQAREKHITFDIVSK
jgi:hypothetical protein